MRNSMRMQGFVPSHARNKSILLRMAELLSDELNLELGATSFFRDDRTAHRRGVAIDLAPRSGPGWHRREQGECPYYYYDSNFIARTIRAARNVHAMDPRLHVVLIEVDHIHVEMDPSGKSPLRVGIYAPRVCNGLCDVPGHGEEVQWVIS